MTPRKKLNQIRTNVLSNLTGKNEKPVESTADFKARLAAMIPKPPQTSGKAPVVRQKGDKGYGYPEGANEDPTKPTDYNGLSHAGYFASEIAKCLQPTERAPNMSVEEQVYVLEVLKTVLEHCEGKGWRSDHVATLVRNTITKLGG